MQAIWEMKNQFVKQDSLTRDFPHNIFRISHDSKHGVIMIIFSK